MFLYCALIFRFLLALFVGMATTQSVFAASTPSYLSNVSVLEDRDGSQTIAGVAQLALADPLRFRALPAGVLTAGYSRSAYWLRFSVEAPAGEWWLDILPGVIDDVRLYEADPLHPGEWRERRSGDLLPFAAREIAYRGFVFKLHHVNAEPHIYYLRVQSTSSVMLALRVQAPEAFRSAATLEFGLLFASLGSLLAVLVLTFVGWCWLRDRLALHFIGYLFFLGGLFLWHTGIVAQYIFPDSPRVADAWISVSSCLVIAFGNSFYQQLFQIGPERRLLYPLYRFVFWFSLLALLSVFSGHYVEAMRVTMTMVLLMTGIGVWLSFRLWRSKDPGGGALLVANLISLLGITAMATSLLGLVSVRFAALYSIHAASIGAVLALILGLSARYRTLQDERLQAIESMRLEHQHHEQQGRFIDLITHEYRTPLAIIKTNIDILALSYDPLRKRESLSVMGIATKRLGDLFNQSQQEGDWGTHRQIRIEAVDPLPLLHELIAWTENAWREPQRNFSLKADGNARVEADPELLRTALRNLLENAAKYGAAQTPIDIRLTADGPAVHILLANDCTGDPRIPADQLLEKQVRGANSEGQPGLGMGLYLVKKIVEDMGGKLQIKLASNGHATRFEALLTLSCHGRGDGA